jgi:hypothetical protein
VEVVGVVADAKYETIGEPPTPAAFNPETQRYNPTTILSVRSSRPEAETASAIRQLASRLDPALPLYDVENAQDMTWISLLPSKAAAVALGAFGVLAMLLAATGLHGLVAYAVSALLIGIGAVAGAGLALAPLRLLSSVVFGVSASDPRALGVVALAMASIGLVSCWTPARRALRLQPAAVLKTE